MLPGLGRYTLFPCHIVDDLAMLGFSSSVLKVISWIECYDGDIGLYWGNESVLSKAG